MGYTRIYRVSGRPLAFVASLNVIQRQGAIRDNTRRSGGFVGMQRRRWTNLPMSEPTNPKSGEKRKPDDIQQNKHREDKEKIKRDFFFPQNFREARKKKGSAYSLPRRTCIQTKNPRDESQRF